MPTPKKPDTVFPLGATFNFPVPPDKKESDFLEAYTGWVYSAVSKISRQVSMIDLKLYKKKYTTNDVEIEEVTDHESLSLLHEVNPFYTKQMFFEITQTYLDLTGECAWAILRSNGAPVQLWPLRPDWISIKPSADEYIDYYTYRPGGIIGNFLGSPVGVKIAKEDLIFFKYPNPLNPYRGKGAVNAGAMVIDIDSFSDEWNRTFFYNSALPSLVFTSDKNMSEAQIKRFMEMWRGKFEGRQNSHRVAFLGGGMKPNPIGGNVKELDFLEGKKYIRDEILAMFHTSKANLGVVEDVNRATQGATDARFDKDVIKPRMTALVSYLNEFYLTNWSKEEGLFFDFVDPTPEDTDLKLKVYKSGLGGDGGLPWLTINEVRERENLPPADNGDIILIPFSFQSSGGVLDNQPKGLLEKMFNKEKKEDIIILKVPKKSAQQKLKESLTLPIPPKRLRELKKHFIKKAIKSDLVTLIMNLMKIREPNRKNARDEFWKTMIAKTDVEELLMKKKLKDLWDDQEKVVNSKLMNYGKDLDTIKYKSLRIKKLNDFLFDLEEENNKWYGIFAPFMKKIVEDKGREIFDFLGIGRQLNTTTATAVRFLKTQGLSFIPSVNNTTLDRLRNTLSEGLIAGEGIDDLSLRIQDVYEAADTSRAQMIARTEVLKATNFATNEAYKQSEVVKGKEWLTAVDERVCFPPTTKILTKEGYKEICKIKKGELVLTHMDRYKKVIDTMKRMYGGNFVRITLKGGHKNRIALSATEDHPILTNSGWKKIKELKVGERVSYVGKKCKGCNKIIPIYFGKYCKDCTIKKINQRIWENPKQHERVVRQNRTYKKAGIMRVEFEKKLKDKVFNKKFGNSVSNGIRNWYKVPANYLKMKQANQEKAKRPDWGWRNKERLTNSLKIAFKKLGENHLGGTYLEKKVEWWLDKDGIKFEKQKYFNNGSRRFWVDFYLPEYNLIIEADGSHFHTKLLNDKRDTELKEVFSGNILHLPEKDIRFDFPKCVSMFEQMTMSQNCFTELEVKSIKKWKLAKPQPVYNLTVEDDETYVANNIVVHNCPYCNKLDGKIIELTKTFVQDGEEINAEGETLAVSGNIIYPPLHPQCRCTIIPILNERLVQTTWQEEKPKIKVEKKEELKK